ncbi:MAG: serine--tRNA ligase [Candidatus Midichloria mitochondrii]|uniref:Serine--tRNA ligase n=1 Tax=Midichloria mitochondrii (strain IricVA) TaxID=696127 RepID=F7XVK7_MIDMI|nr:serine--tRNA ligase [Candidatus Midichloria mitochondrii]AEI88706.1 seryl-tRNA synthetase [Candidatus Midichloria mitochondrii IricVA]MDJ1256678.1 serine--tRNA ligase [Candidatus Midichloria mitochondrii]MDJ1288400.1 serine--tRNA ligase [Candidatus Midichloria mitochondrii]MDJ1299240.1 serine--tRNA ligase [Candidatus Midichloria mitochondrii]MDJ1313366.1 serine--tRNA ligase [Candidatus Midichloria mitochondrii]
MWDVKFIRENLESFIEGMQKRGEEIDLAQLLELDASTRKQKSILQELQNKRNQIAKQIGILKSKNSPVPESLFSEAESINKESPIIEQQIAELDSALQHLLCRLPNNPATDVPFGKSEEDNIVIRKVGEVRQFDFIPKQHFDIDKGRMDFERAAEISGSRFVILKNDFALMERALINFMLDHHTEQFGYTEFSLPYMVNAKSMFGTGQLPKFSEDSFETKDGFRLIPTAEVPLTNLVSDQIIEEKQLPLRMTAHTPCFRSEAGSAGKDTRGMLRQHQFHKVELVSIVKPEDSENELERMTSVAESVLQKLELPYRVMLLCSQDMGFSAKKTYDIEVWLPGQNCYREISSCSNCGDFQARRMKARYRDERNKQIVTLHTLNGSALAVGRAMVAIIENYQNENGDIIIPKVLQSYMNNKTVIKASKNG